jgi:hypothetical protein
MNANRLSSLRSLAIATALGALVASCATPPPPPAPRPLPRPAYTPPPPPRIDPSVDWRDAPITPGEWRWSQIGGFSSARFAENPAGATLEFRCDRRSGTVVLIRSGSAAQQPVPLTITTTSTERALVAQPLPGQVPAIAVSLAAHDPLLDAIIFSRGRFAVEAQGAAPLYVPTWPEIARVVEDCR